jgi:hypothetical protein
VVPDSCKFWIYEWEKRVIMDSGEAELRARKFIKQRHSRVERIFFRTMYKVENSWILQGEVQFKRAFFFAVNRSFELRINMDTGEVVFYEENPLPQLKAK